MRDVSKPQPGSHSGVVSTVEFYTLAEGKRRMGWTDSAYRSARRAGLQVLTLGKRRYVTGQALLTFLERAAND